METFSVIPSPKVSISGCCQLQGAKADVIEGLVVQEKALISIFNQLMERQHCVVGLHHCVGDFRRWDHREGLHDSVRVLLTDLGYKKCAHAGTRASTKGVAQLETLKAITTLGLFANNVQDRIDQLSTFSVVTLGPIITCPGLAKNKVVRAKKLTERACAYAVHGTWFQIHKDRAWHISPTGGLIEVHIDAFQLQIGIAMVGACRVNPMLIGDHFPKLCTDLVATLTALDVNELAHGACDLEKSWLES